MAVGKGGSMTPVAFEQAIEQAIKSDALDEVTRDGFAAMEEALGFNAVAYLAGVDRLCRRMRQLGYQAAAPVARAHEAGAVL